MHVSAIHTPPRSETGATCAPFVESHRHHCRDATPADFAALAAIYIRHAAAGTGPFEPPPSEAEMLRRFATVLEAGHPLSVVTAEGGEPLAYCHGGHVAFGPGFGDVVRHSIYVREDMGGRGVGGLALRHFLSRCRLRGTRAVVGYIRADNAPSLAFHGRHGFLEVGRHPRALALGNGRRIDLVSVQRSLPHPGGRDAP